MAGRIPERQRRKLASQQVGTPGLDLSSARLAGQLAGTSEAFAKEARKESLAKRKVEAKQTALRKGALIDSRSAIGLVDLNNDLDDLKRGSKDIRDYNEKAGALLQERIDDIEDDELRASFSSDASRLLKNKNTKFSKDFRNEELDEIKSNLDSTTDRFAQSIGDLFSNKTEGAAKDLPGKIDTFNFLVEMFTDSSNKFKDALGSASLADFKQKAATEFARSAIDGLMETNPEDVDKFLDSSGVSELLPPDEVRAIKTEASKLRQARQRDSDFQRKVLQSSTATNFFKDTAEGRAPSPTVLNFSVAEGTLTKEDADSIRKYESSLKKKEFLGDNPKTYSGLLTSYGAITVDKRGKRKVSDEATLESLSIFRQQVMESMQTGDISRATGKKWLAMIGPKFDEEVTKTLDNIGNVNIVSGTWEGITSLFSNKDDKTKLELTVELQNDLMQMIDEQEDLLGKRLNIREMSGIVEDLKINFTFKNNKARIDFPAGRVITIEDIRYKVVGHAEDGMPLLDPNLSAPLLDRDK